jgi:hypothetical protein
MRIFSHPASDAVGNINVSVRGKGRRQAQRDSAEDPARFAPAFFPAGATFFQGFLARCTHKPFATHFVTRGCYPCCSSTRKECTLKASDKNSLSSKKLLEIIDLSEVSPDFSTDFLDEEDDLNGDLVPSLLERYRQLKEVRHEIRLGMILTWKPGLKNRKWLMYGKPCVVVEVLDTPVCDLDETGSTYYREPLDMVIGFFLESGEHRGDFLVFHANSERYQPWQGKEE